MEDNEVMNEEYTEDVVEVDPEIIEDSDDGFDPRLLILLALAGAGSVIVLNRNRIAAWWDKKQEKRWKKWCDKTGRTYVTVVPVNDTENSEDEKN